LYRPAFRKPSGAFSAALAFLYAQGIGAAIPPVLAILFVKAFSLDAFRVLGRTGRTGRYKLSKLLFLLYYLYDKVGTEVGTR
jgi:hypothetical protein